MKEFSPGSRISRQGFPASPREWHVELLSAVTVTLAHFNAQTSNKRMKMTTLNNSDIEMRVRYDAILERQGITQFKPGDMTGYYLAQMLFALVSKQKLS